MNLGRDTWQKPLLRCPVLSFLITLELPCHLTFLEIAVSRVRIVRTAVPNCASQLHVPQIAGLIMPFDLMYTCLGMTQVK